MNSATLPRIKDYSVKGNLKFFLSFFLLIIPLFILVYSGITKERLLLFVGLVMILDIAWNFQYSAYFLILTIFFSFYINFFHSSIYASVILLISFMLTKPDFRLSQIQNPFTKPLLIYIVCVIPSLINSIDPLLSIYNGINLLAMIIIMYTVSIAIDKTQKIDRIIIWFLSLVALNAIYVIYLAAVSGKRVYGFPGVFYSDFAGLAAIMITILFILEEKSLKKIILGLITSLILIGLILTQTRNSWIAFALTFFALIIYLLGSLRIPSKTKRRAIAYTLVLVIVIIAIYFGAELLSRGIVTRSTSITTHKINPESLESIGNNSLLTRVFIWHTALMAFLKHPIVGIGYSSFYFSSQLYYTIPAILFDMFARGSHPHITYLAVLVETGIVGLIGFLIFLYSIAKHALKSLKLNQNCDEFKRTLLINWSFVYVFVSMGMTDAWLWGQITVLFGFLLGLTVANYKIISSKQIIV